MFSSKQPITRVYRIKHMRTLQYVWVEDYVVPIMDESGLIKTFYGSARDITARKSVELEREKLIQELNNQHDELMQFSHIVSHNLRSPVASILGLCQLLKDDISPEDNKNTTDYILQAAETMDEVLHDLNTILSTRSTFNEKKEYFVLEDIIRSMRISLQKEIGRTNATIITDIAPDASQIFSVKSYVHSAILNLTSNGIKYRAKNSEPVILIKAVYNAGNIQISVTDNGIGIDLAAHQHRLFSLYGRLNLDTEGKGLGLYMTKVQIEALGGRIAVESVVGKGTTFTITLKKENLPL